jgi:hypothetical protein
MWYSGPESWSPWEIGQESLVCWTNDRANCCPSRKLIMCISPPIACGRFSLDLATFRDCLVHWFKSEVPPKWERHQQDLNTLQNIHVALCLQDVWIIFNPTISSQPKFESTEKLWLSIWWLTWFDVEDVQSTPHILIYPCCCLLAKCLSLLNVVCRMKRILQIPLIWVLAMLIVQSSWFAIYFPLPIFHSNYLPMSTCLCLIRRTGQITHRGSILSSSAVSSCGGTPGTLSKGRWICSQSSSIAFQEHRLNSNQIGSCRSQPTRREIPSLNSHSFFDIGWYFG